MRISVFWGPYWGPLILGNYHIYPIAPLKVPLNIGGNLRAFSAESRRGECKTSPRGTQGLRGCDGDDFCVGFRGLGFRV